MPSDYKKQWEESKKLFETTAKVKKPSVKVMGLFKTGTGIESALKDVDSAVDAFDGAKEKTTKLLDAFKSKATVFASKANDYLKVLADAVGKEPKGADADGYKKGVEVLKTKLTALKSTMDSKAAGYKSGLDHDSGIAATAKNLIVFTRGAVDRGLAFCAKVRSNPTPVEFNTGIVKACRDVTQQIGNVDKIIEKGYVIGKEQPTNLFKILKAWGNDGRQVPVDATAQIVTREVGALEQALKGVAAWLA